MQKAPGPEGTVKAERLEGGETCFIKKSRRFPKNVPDEMRREFATKRNARPPPTSLRFFVSPEPLHRAIVKNKKSLQCTCALLARAPAAHTRARRGAPLSGDGGDDGGVTLTRARTTPPGLERRVGDTSRLEAVIREEEPSRDEPMARTAATHAQVAAPRPPKDDAGFHRVLDTFLRADAGDQVRLGASALERREARSARAGSVQSIPVVRRPNAPRYRAAPPPPPFADAPPSLAAPRTRTTSPISSTSTSTTCTSRASTRTRRGTPARARKTREPGRFERRASSTPNSRI